MSWYSGSQLTSISLESTRPACPLARMLASRFSWVSSTPLGAPVLPEVYWMSAAS
jgi:hypothetical protein